MPRVLIIQSQIKQYRVPFFTQLHQALQSDGIQLMVAHSEAPRSERSRADTSDLPTEFSVPVKGYWGPGECCLYQPLLREVSRADVVIVEHASRYLLNYVLVLMRVAGWKRLGFWGLGSNKQADRSSLAEWYKRMILRWADCYFAYTCSVARELAAFGLPEQRITVVQNATDIRSFQLSISSISDSELEGLRRTLGIPASAIVGLFCGMMEPVKGISFLLESAQLIKNRTPNFHLILVGGCHQAVELNAQVLGRPWVHVVGPKFGREKAAFFKLSDVLLLPGRVGLVILDAFAAGLPLFTVDIPIHGPEIDYLETGANGYIVPRHPSMFADAVVGVINNPELLSRLKQAAFGSANKCTVEVMVENFRSGIIRCLTSKSLSGNVHERLPIARPNPGRGAEASQMVEEEFRDNSRAT